MRVPAVVVLALLSAWRLEGQIVSYHEAEFHGRQAYVLENQKMRVSALRGAGHLAEMALKSDNPKLNVNPMRVPHFSTIEPWEYDPRKHDPIYGGGKDTVLMSGYMGHLLNFPTFGAPSDREARNGLGTHGEALAVEWKKDAAVVAEDAVRLVYSAHLPKTQYNVGRTLTLPADETVLYIEEWAENLLDFDRPAHWVQHVTFGPPFAEPGKTILDMSATRGEVRAPDGPSSALRKGAHTWPTGASRDGQQVSLRPMQSHPKSGVYYAALMDPRRERNYFTMYHEDYRVLIGYVWYTKDFPWVVDWQENKRNTTLPWNGQVVARGIEVGTTPFTGPMEEVVREGSLYGVPVYRWMGGQERVTVKYVAFLAEIPEGYRGVEDVAVHAGKIVITERETKKPIALKSAHPW